MTFGEFAGVGRDGRPFAAYPSGSMGQDWTPPGVALGGEAALAECQLIYATSQDHSPGLAKLFRDELLRKRHATQNNALSRQRPAATVLSEGKFAAMFVTDLGAVPMRPRGAGALYARIRAHQFPFWLDQICLGLAGGHLCSNLLARINQLPRTARVRLLSGWPHQPKKRSDRMVRPIVLVCNLYLAPGAILH